MLLMKVQLAFFDIIFYTSITKFCKYTSKTKIMKMHIKMMKIQKNLKINPWKFFSELTGKIRSVERRSTS